MCCTVNCHPEEYAYPSQFFFSSHFHSLILSYVSGHGSDIDNAVKDYCQTIDPELECRPQTATSYLAVKMLNNWETIPIISAVPSPWISPPVVVFPAPVAWVQRRASGWQHAAKIWLTCFMWHFNFPSVNQHSCCISLIALLDWQLMIDLVLGSRQKCVITKTSMQIHASEAYVHLLGLQKLQDSLVLGLSPKMRRTHPHLFFLRKTFKQCILILE